jgi:hypothetical protein
LAVLSLRGFKCSRYRNILDRSSLWKRKTRNKGLVILEGKQVGSYKKNSNKIKEGEQMKREHNPQARDARSRRN